MARVTTYLSFQGKTEEAFLFYRSIFKTEFATPMNRMGDVPPGPGMPKLSEREKRLVMHVALPILGGHVLMGTDAVESMGHTVVFGTNVTINLEPDSRAEADRLWKALSEGGKAPVPLRDMFWGAYWGSLTDRYGVQWMFNYMESKP